MHPPSGLLSVVSRTHTLRALRAMTPANSDRTNVSLPTLDLLGVNASSLENVNAADIAREWLDSFGASLSSANADAAVAHIVPDGFWRDFFSMTWVSAVAFTSDYSMNFLAGNAYIPWPRAHQNLLGRSPRYVEDIGCPHVD